MYGFMDQRRAELAADWAGGDVNQADTWLNREATSDEDVRQEPMRSTSLFSSSSRLCIPCIRCSCSRCSRVVGAVPPTGGAGGASPPIAQEEARGLFQNDPLKKTYVIGFCQTRLFWKPEELSKGGFLQDLAPQLWRRRWGSRQAHRCCEVTLGDTGHQHPQQRVLRDFDAHHPFHCHLGGSSSTLPAFPPIATIVSRAGFFSTVPGVFWHVLGMRRVFWVT